MNLWMQEGRRREVRGLGQTCTLHTVIFKMDNQQKTYCVAQGTQLSVMWQPGVRGVWGEMDTCVHVAESLHC